MEKRRIPTTLIVLLVFSLFGVGAAALVVGASNTQLTNSTANNTPTRRVLRENTPAPDFTLTTLEGANIKLSDYQGRRIMLNFWASWCAPCLAETPDLVSAYNNLLKQGESDILFVGIGVNDDIQNLRKFAENNRVPYLIINDPTSVVADAYGVIAMPITVFIDEKGLIYRKFIGAVKQQQVIDVFKEMKGGK
ncbi:MAG: TlpA disulfide reductase family protein [Chloroflexota bacterium]|jgi:peroxiredoxin|nr:TlpA family protein disulfide reductase [Chloroflexota bacterium]